jgi:hypothetical protein
MSNDFLCRFRSTFVRTIDIFWLFYYNKNQGRYVPSILTKGVKKMIKANGIKGKYLEFNGKPLVREGDEIYYGDMADKFYLFMLVMSEKKASKLDMMLPDQVMVQILPTDGSQRIEKQKMVKGLAEAFDIGTAWLERANRV